MVEPSLIEARFVKDGFLNLVGEKKGSPLDLRKSILRDELDPKLVPSSESKRKVHYARKIEHEKIEHNCYIIYSASLLATAGTGALCIARF